MTDCIKARAKRLREVMNRLFDEGHLPPPNDLKITARAARSHYDEGTVEVRTNHAFDFYISKPGDEDSRVLDAIAEMEPRASVKWLTVISRDDHWRWKIEGKDRFVELLRKARGEMAEAGFSEEVLARMDDKIETERTRLITSATKKGGMS